MNVRYVLFSLIFVLAVGLISYNVTHALFSDTAESFNNTFTAANVFPTPTGVAAHIVISEVQIATPGATTSDFVELYNPTSNPVNLDGFDLVKRTKTGSSDTTLKSFSSSDTIPAHGFYLWASTDGGYAAQIGADVSTSQNITDDNSVAIKDESGGVVDALAWGSGHTAPLVETTPFSTNPSAGSSIERKALSTSDATSMTSGADVSKGNGFDSNNNSIDVILREIAQPQNSTSLAEMP